MKKESPSTPPEDTDFLMESCGVWLGDPQGLQQNVSLQWDPEQGLRQDWFGSQTTAPAA